MTAKPMITNKIPAPKTKRVGVKSAVTGAALWVAIGVGVAVGLMVGVGVSVGVVPLYKNKFLRQIWKPEPG